MEINMRYKISHALVQFGGDVILRDVNFEVHDKEKIAIVGRNGCGKTTLLRLIAGDISMNNLDSDEECGITMAGKQEIGFLRQVNFTEKDVTVEEEIKKVFEPVFACEKRMRELENEMKTSADKQLLREYDNLQSRMEAMRGYSWQQDMETMFQRFGFALEDLKRPIGSFSGGQQTKVAFIKLLLKRPDIMLLDEPTNHLDLPTIEWLEGYLKTYDKAVIIVSHDRMFLDKVIDVTYEIEYHEIKRYAGNYTAFMRQKEEALIKQEKDYEEQQKEIKRLTDWIEKWKNTPTKVAATRSKRMEIEHMVKIEKPRHFDTKAFHARYVPRMESYTNVIHAKNLEIGYDTVFYHVSSFKLSLVEFHCTIDIACHEDNVEAIYNTVEIKITGYNCFSRLFVLNSGFSRFFVLSSVFRESLFFRFAAFGDSYDFSSPVPSFVGIGIKVSTDTNVCSLGLCDDSPVTGRTFPCREDSVNVSTSSEENFACAEELNSGVCNNSEERRTISTCVAVGSNYFRSTNFSCIVETGNNVKGFKSEFCSCFVELSNHFVFDFFNIDSC